MKGVVHIVMKAGANVNPDKAVRALTAVSAAAAALAGVKNSPPVGPLGLKAYV